MKNVVSGLRYVGQECPKRLKYKNSDTEHVGIYACMELTRPTEVPLGQAVESQVGGPAEEVFFGKINSIQQ